MKLHEYQSKRIFAQYGIAVPLGEVVTTPQAAREVAGDLGKTVAIKSQILISGRGKAGGIQIARDADEAYRQSDRMLGMALRGLRVQKVLVEEAIADNEGELYLAVTVDRAMRKPVLIAAREGGADVEETTQQHPEELIKVPVDPLLGLLDFQVRTLAFDLGLEGKLAAAFFEVAKALYQVFVEHDASLVEINPLMITPTGDLVAADAKITVDDNAIFRHPMLAALRDEQAEDRLEREARLAGLSYVRLKGDIGVVVNGAGLALATLDLLNQYGGHPANFLDMGGGAKTAHVAAALRILLSNPVIKVILINVFGGLTRCDEIAYGIVTTLSQVQTTVPIITRLAGTNEETGRTILNEANIPSAAGLNEAARRAVEMAGAGVCA